MNIELAIGAVEEERRAFWDHIEEIPARRRAQNLINKRIERWIERNQPQTAEEYLTLASVISSSTYTNHPSYPSPSDQQRIRNTTPQMLQSSPTPAQLHKTNTNNTLYEGFPTTADSVPSRSTSHTFESITIWGREKVSHLIATCLFKSPHSQMSVREIYEWLTGNYPLYQYTKSKISAALRNDSAKKNPKFMIVNRYRGGRFPTQWAMRPEFEYQFRQFVSIGQEPQVSQSLDESLWPNHYEKYDLAFDCPGSMRQQREAHKDDATISPTVYKEIGSVVNTPVRREPGTISSHDSWNLPRAIPASEHSSLTPEIGQPVPSLENPSSTTEASSRKRRYLSHQQSPTISQNPVSTSQDPPIIWNNLQQNFEEGKELRHLERRKVWGARNIQENPARVVIPISNTRCDHTEYHNSLRHERSALVSEIEAAVKARKSLDAAISESAALRQKARSRSSKNAARTRNNKLHTKAVIVSETDLLELGHVEIDGNSLHNLLPLSIVDKLGLSLYFGCSVRIKVANRNIPINQYCRFKIRLAGVETTIDACVVSDLSSLVLGCGWIQEVNLLSDFQNHTYYIPGPHVNLNEIPGHGSTTENKTDFLAEEGISESGCVSSREIASVRKEVPRAADAGEYNIVEFASCRESVESATEVGSISDSEDWEDALY
ncbi:hypothetical protein F5882DRAFT_470489 [Hyaloscypha sp. PMI_1271]|nr:hypothetical protein F5882DRAFT_470489 [Hyaloscypha sp. PMI_1271]